jgi:hypothetical protein
MPPVVLRGRKRQHVVTVAQHEERGFLTGEEFFDDDTRVAERDGEDRVDRRLGLGERRRDDDALAGGEPVGLDDDRPGHPPQVILRRLGGLETLIGRGGDAVRPAQILGEAF